MLFCQQCGGALNLFESNDEEICYHCIRRRDTPPAAPPAQPAPPVQDDAMEPLLGATFHVEGDKLVLTAAEGWVLWSGPLATPVPFETIIQRAGQIHRIRRRRKQQQG